MISASKTTYSHYNLKILKPNVTKNIKKFCEFRPWALGKGVFDNRTSLEINKGSLAFTINMKRLQ